VTGAEATRPLFALLRSGTETDPAITAILETLHAVASSHDRKPQKTGAGNVSRPAFGPTAGEDIPKPGIPPVTVLLNANIVVL
jgi:hypothetical protein